MSTPPFANIFGSSEAFSSFFGANATMECRFDNDVNGNPIYVGMSPISNADPDANVWYIYKIEYTGSNPVRKRLPDDGVKPSYSWTDRVSLFS